MKILQTDMFSYSNKVKEAVLNYDVGGLVPNIDIAKLIAAVIGEYADMLTCMKLKEEGLRSLLHFSINEFKEFGLSEDEAIKLHASFLLTKSVMSENVESGTTLSSPESVYEYFSYLKYEKQEQFVVAFLDTKNKVIKKQTIFVGSLNASLVYPREIFREAIKLSAASIIATHQHPTGDPTPSNEDIQVTRRLVEAGRIMGVELLDHVVIGERTFVSIRDKKGWIFEK